MKNIQLLYESTAQIKKEDILRVGRRLQSEIERLGRANNQGYNSVYASLNLVYDTPLIDTVQKLAENKKALGVECLVVIGIGGSILGTQAIHQALHGIYYNELDPKIKVYFLDTVDPDMMHDCLTLLEGYLSAGKKILVNVITKSGTTIETIANFEVVRACLQKYHPQDYNNYIVVTTDKESPLWHVALNKKFSILEIPVNVGGRFSVLSAATLFPCAILAIDIVALQKGARDILAHVLNTTILENPAAISAIIKYIHYTKHAININNLFVFGVYLEALGKWYTQLMAESIGKERDIEGKKVHVGITPTVSVGTIDLHSVGQLYLGGPYDKFITFCSLEEYTHNIEIPKFQEYTTIENRSLQEIMNAILKGVKRAYHKEDRPFCEIVIPKRDPYFLGQFLQLYMVEIIYLGFLLHINPFDQPNVEMYKQETREILSNE